MILNDAEINARVTANHLVEGHRPENIGNCTCTLTAGAVFRAETGAEIQLQPTGVERARFWEIGPSETLIVMTSETIRLPADLCAAYAPLHRLAARGVMLLNPALVEPLYEGPLSCVLVNFSSERVQIAFGEPISKLVFHSTTAPANPQPLRVNRDAYSVTLSKNATRFHKSFLDVSGIEDRAAAKAKSGLKGWAITSGFFLAVLIAFASIEPLVSKWLFEKTGVVTATQRTADATLVRDLDASRELLQAAEEQQTMRRELDALRTQIEDLTRQLLTERGR